MVKFVDDVIAQILLLTCLKYEIKEKQEFFVPILVGLKLFGAKLAHIMHS